MKRRNTTVNTRGYTLLRLNGAYVLEHRHVMEQHLGRKLTSNEIVRHRNGNKLNNELSNLVLMSRSDASREHSRDPIIRYRKREAMKLVHHIKKSP